jgi:lipoic acid synthetase
VDNQEPLRVAQAVAELAIDYAVVTSVTRDDLPDGGAGQFAATIAQIRRQCPETKIEVLVPDFSGSESALKTVCAARPDVFNHNIETVHRLYAAVRPQADYHRSLKILSIASSAGLPVKTGLMLGLGETQEEIFSTLMDLKAAGCIHLTFGQYLRPSNKHAPVDRYVKPEEFFRWAQTAESMGFIGVAAGPLVRSSYRAKDMFQHNEAVGYDSNPWQPGQPRKRAHLPLPAAEMAQQNQLHCKKPQTTYSN